MHAGMLEGFQDELTKIAYTEDELYNMGRSELQLSPEKARLYAKSHLPMYGGSYGSGAAPAAATPIPLTNEMRVQGATKTHVPVSEATQVGIRPSTAVQRGPAVGGPQLPAAAHTVPHTAPHPTKVPGGMSGALRRGGSLLRAHAAPLAIGAGAAGLGALALSRMGKKNAPSR